MVRRLLPLLPLLAACEGDVSDVEVHTARIALVRTAQGLQLDAAPMLNAQPVYPNPRGHEWMQLFVNSDGRVIVSCLTPGSRTACSDSPVYVQIDSTRSGEVMRAYELYQNRLAEFPYTGNRCGGGGI